MKCANQRVLSTTLEELRHLAEASTCSLKAAPVKTCPLFRAT
jgi:hypothetical protein